MSETMTATSTIKLMYCTKLSQISYNMNNCIDIQLSSHVMHNFKYSQYALLNKNHNYITIPKDSSDYSYMYTIHYCHLHISPTSLFTLILEKRKNNHRTML